MTFAISIAIALLKCLSLDPSPTIQPSAVGLIAPASAVAVGDDYYQCEDPSTGLNPFHPAFDACHLHAIDN